MEKQAEEKDDGDINEGEKEGRALDGYAQADTEKRGKDRGRKK